MFDQTDMAKAKEIEDDRVFIFDNVPSFMLKLGTPQDAKDYCKKRIYTAGKGGDFVMGNRAFFGYARPENITAMVVFTKGYGVNG